MGSEWRGHSRGIVLPFSKLILFRPDCIMRTYEYVDQQEAHNTDYDLGRLWIYSQERSTNSLH